MTETAYLPTICRLTLCWGISLSLILFSSCSSEDKYDSDRPLVVSTTGMIGDLIANIGGDSIQSLSLMGPGVDPHLYKATQGDLAKLRSADLIVYNGLHLEGKMGEVLKQLGKVQKVRALGQYIDTSKLLADPAYPEAYDPHIWFDIHLWSTTIDSLAKAIIDIKPDAKAYFLENAVDYKLQLGELNQWVYRELKSIPEEQRKLITAHDAFKYFGAAYGIQVRGLQGISTVSEFGLKDRVDLVNYILDHKVPAIFLETSVSDRNIRSVIEACRKKGHNVALGGSLYSDAMGAKNTKAGTYLGMVSQNVHTIVEALKAGEDEN